MNSPLLDNNKLIFRNCCYFLVCKHFSNQLYYYYILIDYIVYTIPMVDCGLLEILINFRHRNDSSDSFEFNRINPLSNNTR